MARKRIYTLIVLMLVAVALPLLAQQKGEQETLVVGVLQDFQPQYRRDDSGAPGGFAVETFNEIAARADLQYRYRFLKDWDAMLGSLRIGEIDIIPNLGITPARQEYFAFTRPLEHFELGLFVLKSNETVQGLADMQGQVVATVERNAGVKLLARHPAIEKRVYKHAEQALFALMGGDVQGLVYPIPVVNSLASRYQVDERIRQAGPAVMKIERAMAVRSDRTELLSQLDKAITGFVDSPEFQEIHRRWNGDGGAPQAQPEQITVIGSSVIVLVALGMVVLLWRYRHQMSEGGFRAAVALLVIAMIGGLYYALEGDTSRTEELPLVTVVHLSKVDSSTYAGFLVKMKELGYEHGINIRFDYKGPAGSIDRLDGLIQEYLAMEPDLILVSSTPGTMAVKRLTEGMGIPAVFAPVNDPLDAGVVESLQYPGGDITGVRLPAGDDLRLQWLTRIAPDARKIYVPFTQGDKSAESTLRQIEAVAPRLGVELLTRPLDSKDAIHGPGSVVPADADAIYLPRDSTVEARVDEFVKLAMERKLPVCTPSEKQVLSGTLFSYGFVHYEIGRQAAQLVDQVLRGARPADLPVLTAENYLLINMKTAKTIGLEVPEAVVRQANRLIYE
ncbi:MAG: ABC transporter substrate binding protein [Sedimenticola sp.]